MKKRMKGGWKDKTKVRQDKNRKVDEVSVREEKERKEYKEKQSGKADTD